MQSKGVYLLWHGVDLYCLPPSLSILVASIVCNTYVIDLLEKLPYSSERKCTRSLFNYIINQFVNPLSLLIGGLGIRPKLWSRAIAGVASTEVNVCPPYI